VKQLPLGVRLPAHAVFDSFASGANAEIVAALRDPVPLPLWLWGAPGSGKTHLLQAACAHAAAAGSGKGAYFSLDPALGLPPEALAGYERAQVLCVDDVDEVAASESWERALFELFNAAGETGTKLIFAAEVAPRGIDWCLDDWRSRAAACLVYQVQELDDAGRAEALRLRAAQRGLQLPHETSEYLLKRMPRDLPSLCRLLDELDEASLVAQRRLTIPFIRDALERHALERHAETKS
jgi:DnaA-homolog protein